MTVIEIIIGILVLSEVIKRICKSERVQARIKKALGIKSPSNAKPLYTRHGGKSDLWPDMEKEPCKGCNVGFYRISADGNDNSCKQVCETYKLYEVLNEIQKS